jgi:hypothetical protein
MSLVTTFALPSLFIDIRTKDEAFLRRTAELAELTCIEADDSLSKDWGCRRDGALRRFERYPSRPIDSCKDLGGGSPVDSNSFDARSPGVPLSVGTAGIGNSGPDKVAASVLVAISLERISWILFACSTSSVISAEARVSSSWDELAAGSDEENRGATPLRDN